MKVNRNILWAELFVNQLVKNGVKFACISPGSRSTPLTYCFAKNKNIKTYINIDERSSAFYALGLAKVSRSPVILVSTSGTATAEFYPAIIEAYQSRIPLIVCTADRPPELLNTGANQTINQNNIYKNHIRWYADAGLPDVSETKLKSIIKIAVQSVFESRINSPGPVHINFPFKKPFEPESYTDQISKKLLHKISNSNKKQKLKYVNKTPANNTLKEIVQYVKETEKGIIVVGPENYSKDFSKKIFEISKLLNYPVFADGASQLRYSEVEKENLCENYDAFLRSEKIRNENKPGLVLQFGRTFTSTYLEKYLNDKNIIRILINENGDLFDPLRLSKKVVKSDPFEFCLKLFELIKTHKIKKENDWLGKFIFINERTEKIKNKIVAKSRFPSESRIIIELFKVIPQNSNLMVSNSLPIRDLDNFTSSNKKKLNIFSNRGASGIDGITSTALGIAAEEKKHTFLITGDLAFYHDLNGLLSSKKYKIPLTIILINNNGGRIFELLPISNYGKIFDEFFTTPHNLDFSGFVKSYGGYYIKIKNWKNFSEELLKSVKRKKLSVLEIKTNSGKSLTIRKKFWQQIIQELN